MSSLSQKIEMLVETWADQTTDRDPKERLGLKIASNVLRSLLETSKEDSGESMPLSDSIASGRE